ncbi:MAG: sigma-70 family RNA polymerase sigma factor [Ruminiclostridium sp.]|nr:sigma-70 family RNA polymerase sigma factor [Ruminiclostridium sp.]
MEDKEIISLYWERSETAIAETDKKYRPLCMRIARNILNDSSDAEECLSDAYLAVWNTIPPQRPEHFAAFVCRIVKNLALKKYEHIHAAKRDPNVQVSFDELDGLADNTDVEKLCSSKELGAKISAFLQSERQVNRVVFVRRYWFFDSPKEIAKCCGMTENGVNALLMRMRNRLKDYLRKEGVYDE